MYRMNGNPGQPAANHRLLATVLRLKAHRSTTFPRVRPSRTRGRRRDDATFIAIAALLAILFVTQAGWVIAQQTQPGAGISSP
jgi:hypothetical protein